LANEVISDLLGTATWSSEKAEFIYLRYRAGLDFIIKYSKWV